MTMLGQPTSPLRVFRYMVRIGPKSIATAALRWDGVCLTITRGIVEGRPPLAAELHGPWPEAFRRVVLLNRDGHPVRTWRLTFDRILDRGPSFLDALKDDIALESVALVNAELKAIDNEGS